MEMNVDEALISTVLSQKLLVQEAPKLEDLVARIRKCGEEKRPLRMLYGETFDDKGNLLDSLKYYLFMSTLAKSVESSCSIKVESTVLIADLGVYRNYPEQIEELKKCGKDRVKFANKVRSTYDCSYEVKLLSDVAATDGFKGRLDKIKELSSKNSILMGMLKNTVPEDRRETEKERGYTYAFEEVAAIMGLDVKVGPPREKLYDSAANSMLEHLKVDPLMPVYLAPTYPLGMKYGDYLSSGPIKQYGLTPYKVGSSNLGANRIIMGVTKPDEIKKLIEDTQISASESKPNPVLDLAIIADMAKQHLEKSQSDMPDICNRYYNNKMQSKELKEITYERLKEYVLNRLG